MCHWRHRRWHREADDTDPDLRKQAETRGAGDESRTRVRSLGIGITGSEMHGLGLDRTRDLQILESADSGGPSPTTVDVPLVRHRDPPAATRPAIRRASSIARTSYLTSLV